jgi:hypothetical protein
MTKNNTQDLREKVVKGLELAYARLLTAKQAEDAYLVISKAGKIIRVRAREITR